MEATCIEKNELAKWLIRVSFGEDAVKGMVESDEIEDVEDSLPDKFSISVYDGREVGKGTSIEKNEYIKNRFCKT